MEPSAHLSAVFTMASALALMRSGAAQSVTMIPMVLTGSDPSFHSREFQNIGDKVRTQGWGSQFYPLNLCVHEVRRVPSTMKCL